jgi:hypothetical protein
METGSHLTAHTTTLINLVQTFWERLDFVGLTAQHKPRRRACSPRGVARIEQKLLRE